MHSIVKYSLLMLNQVDIKVLKAIVRHTWTKEELGIIGERGDEGVPVV